MKTKFFCGLKFYGQHKPFVEFASFNINGNFHDLTYIVKKALVWSSLKPFSKKLSMMNTCDNV